MIIKIYLKDYSRIDSLTIDGVKLVSIANIDYNNIDYYINKKDKSILCELSDKTGFYYYLIFIVNGEIKCKYIGADFERGSIFEREPDDYGIYCDENGYYAEFFVSNIK